MATIELRLSSKMNKTTLKKEVMIRFYSGHTIDQRSGTEIFSDDDHFAYYINIAATQRKGVSVPPKQLLATKKDAEAKGYVLTNRGEYIVKERINSPQINYLRLQKSTLEKLCRHIEEEYTRADKKHLSPDWLTLTIEKYNHPERIKVEEPDKTIYELAEEFLEAKEYSYDLTRGYKVLIRNLAKYELYIQRTDNSRKHWTWDIHSATSADIADFHIYLKTESKLQKKYPHVFKEIYDTIERDFYERRTPKIVQKGNNTIVTLLKRLRAFFYWLYDTGKTDNRPFEKFKLPAEKYGTPYYLTVEERNHIAEFDFSFRPGLEIQRDIFVFHCYVGCRVSDLKRLTADNVINNILVYIPQKTQESQSQARVPLSEKALQLIEKYRGADPNGRLFPFISETNYNECIKEIVKLSGIDRNVVITNPVTGKEESVPIYEKASSHMARRTFIGAAYKVVKDPNIVGKMSGHVEGSRAFARYRDIDDDVLKEVINLIK